MPFLPLLRNYRLRRGSPPPPHPKTTKDILNKNFNVVLAQFGEQLFDKPHILCSNHGIRKRVMSFSSFSYATNANFLDSGDGFRVQKHGDKMIASFRIQKYGDKEVSFLCKITNRRLVI